MIKKLLLILLLLSVASPALADKEYLYPATSFDNTNWSGVYTNIDDPWDSPNDTDIVTATGKTQLSSLNPLSNISAIQAGNYRNPISPFGCFI